MGRLSLLILAIFLSIIQLALGYFEFCYESTLYKVREADCPFGVFFKRPQELKCIYPKRQRFVTDVCTNSMYVHDPTGANPLSTIQSIIQSSDDKEPTEPTSEPYMSDGCSTTMCKDSEATVEINFSNAANDDPHLDPNYIAKENDHAYVVEGVINDDQHVKDQTHRLFLYLNELIQDEGEDGPELRIVKVMRQSFNVLRKHCDNLYVPKMFDDQLEKAFFFLFREGDLSRLKDVNEDDFENIMGVLRQCEDINTTPFKLNGNECEMKGIVHNITGIQTIIYRRNEQSFQWGKYDPPVDAAWATADFVHGLCYGKFSQNVNKHHLYQVAMESLFTPELIYRWRRPFKLNVPQAWDHVLLANLKYVLRSLDACVQGAYNGSPFLHRLRRPFLNQGDSESFAEEERKRKKRDAESASSGGVNINEAGLKGNVVCFQTATERDVVIANGVANCKLNDVMKVQDNEQS